MGDVIVGMDDHPIAGIDDLHKLLTEDRIGRKSALEVIRRTDKLNFEVIHRSHGVERVNRISGGGLKGIG